MKKEIYRIEVAVDGERVTCRTAAGGDGPTVDIKWSGLNRQLIDLFQKWLRSGKMEESKELSILGAVLLDILLGEESSWLAKQWRSAKDKHKRLQLELSFRPSASHLADLPWEFLYLPEWLIERGRGVFLARETDLILYRHFPGGDRVELSPPTGKLKILFVIVQTEETIREPKSDWAPGINEILDTVKELETIHPIEIVETLRNPTRNQLFSALEKHKPYAVHYIGYGDFQYDHGVIALMGNNSKDIDWCSHNDFADLFEGFQPHLVFLHLCEANDKDDYMKANFASLAEPLLGTEIQAVVAMQYPLELGTASRFTDKFYKELTKQSSVGTAVQEGRRTIAGGGQIRNLGAPVLCLLSEDGFIISAGEDEVPTEETGQVGSLLGSSRESTKSQAAAIAPSSSAAQAPINSGEASLEEIEEIGKGKVRAAPVGLDSEVVLADAIPPPVAIDKSVDLAFEEAVRNGNVKPSEVSRAVERFKKEVRGKDAQGIRDHISSLIAADPESEMVPVYIAMLKGLKSR